MELNTNNPVSNNPVIDADMDANVLKNRMYRFPANEVEMVKMKELLIASYSGLTIREVNHYEWGRMAAECFTGRW